MGLTSEDMNDELARVLAKLTSDNYASFLGIRIIKIERGYAKTEVTVGEHFLNFNEVAHGGFIYSLADVAFAAACNSYNQTAVALSFHITYRRPVTIGVRLFAEASEESSGKTTALYKIVVRTDDQRIVAICEGLAYKQESSFTENDGPEAI
ncbi:MAG: PaaI family thioesterase [Halobacteriota archaeon]